MSKSLDSVHKQIEREKIKKAVAKDVENKIIPPCAIRLFGRNGISTA